MPSAYGAQPAVLAGDAVLVLLVQLALLLALAVTLGRLAARLGLPAVVGELLTGVLLGPSLLGHLAPGLAARLFPPVAEQAHLLDGVALLGILLLVGVTGMHLDVGAVRRRRATVVRVSACGLVVPFALGTAGGYAMPPALLGDGAGRTAFALFLGVAMSVSAIPVIAKTLSDMRLLHRNVGQLTLAAAVIDDAVGWCMLSAVSAFAVTGARPGGIAASLVRLAVFVAVTVTLGRRAAGWLLRRAAADAGATTAVLVVLVLAGATVSHALGLEAVFGAFVAGAVVGSLPQAPARSLAPLRTFTMSVLAPVAFASVGLRVDLRLLADPLVLVAAVAVVALAVVGKFAGAYVGARTSALSHWEGIALGAGLNARGVVEIVVASVGLRLGILTTATYTIVVLVAVATSLMAPPLLRWAMTHVESTAEERLREADLAQWDTALDGSRGEPVA